MNLKCKLDLEMYQAHVQAGFKKHDSFEEEVLDWTLGLSGEVGEVAELLKHGIFHKTPIEKMELAKELADIMWYVTAIATTFDIPLEEALKLNIAKLQHRHGGIGFTDAGSAARHTKEQDFKYTPIYKQLEHEILTWCPESLTELERMEQAHKNAFKYALKQRDFAGQTDQPTNWQTNGATNMPIQANHVPEETVCVDFDVARIPAGYSFDPITRTLKKDME